MTLEQFKKNLELISQIESAKQNNKSSNNVMKNIAPSSNSNNQSILNSKADKKVIRTKSTSSVVSSTKTDKSWLEEKIGDVGEQLEGLRSSARNWGKNLFKKPKAFEDGYQIGDVSKTVGSSLADAGMNVFTGATNLVEGVVKLPLQGVAQVIDWAGNEKVANIIRNSLSDTNPQTASMLSPKLNDWREKYFEGNSVFGNSSDQVASGIGTTIGSAGLQPLGSATVGKLKDIPIGMGLAEMGNSVTENFTKEGVTDAQAWLNGAGKGTVSAISESIFGAFGVGGSELDDVLVKKATQNLNSQLAKGMAQLGIKAGGEAAEEFLEYAGGYLTNLATDMISQGKGAKFYEEWNSDEVLQNMLSAFVSTGITQSGGTISNLVKGNDVITGNTKQVQAQIDQEVQSQIQALQEKGEKVNTAKQLEIERGATEKIYLNKAKQELVDVVNKSENIDKSMKSGILNKIDSTEDFNNLNVISKMINSYDSINKQLAPIPNNTVNVPTNKNISKQTFLESAKANNIDVNNNIEVLDSMFEMAYQRGVNIRIDGKVFTNQNQDALWRVNKETGQREVIVNPNNPTKALQSLTIHELTHDMENTPAYQQLSTVVLDYARKQNNYDTAFKELSDMYSEEYKNYKGDEFNSRIEQEMVADILGQKLGNQEFVNSIVTSNRGVAQNIYSWVVDKLNKINKLTGYKFEKLYWADVKNKFEKAFGSEFNNINEETKYHISSNLSDDIDSVLKGEYDINIDVKLRDFTPQILVNLGLKDLPMLMNQNHLKENILSKTKAKNLGILNNDANYHNLGKNLFMEIIDSLDSPLMVMKSISPTGKSNSWVIVTDVKNQSGEQIIVPIYLNARGNYNDIEIDTNKIKSIYGKNNIKQLVDNTIKGDINNILYMTKDAKKRKLLTTTGLQLSNHSVTSNNIIIPSNENYVNNDTKNDVSPKELAPTSSFFMQNINNLKKLQLEIIQKYNPMLDDSHTGIRTIEDIKTLQETIEDSDWAEYDEYNPDLTKKMIEKAIKVGEITVYSSYPIEQGIFVSPSKMEAESYSGNGKVYSKKVNINDIAWIDPTQGQYAKIDKNINKYSKTNNGVYQQFLKDNFSNDGTKTYMKDIKLAPTKNKNKSKDKVLKEQRKSYEKINGLDKVEVQEIQKVIEDKNIKSKSSDELWNELVSNSSEEAQELLDGRNIEVKEGRKNTKAISNDKSIEISKSGNMYLNNSKPTAEQYRNGLEYHFEKGEKRLAPINNKQVQEGYNVEEWTGNQWEKSNKITKENNILDEESPTLKYLKDARKSDKASFNEIVDSLMQKFVNRGHYIDKLAKETNNPQLKYANDKTLSTFAEAQYSIGIAQTDNKGNEIGKSLIEVFKPVKEAGLSKEFNDYLLNRLNIERQAVEKSLFGPEITSETSRNEIRKYEKQYPQFKEWAEDVYRYNNNELQNLVDAGFISKDTQELFHNMYGDYVPIHRILEETVNKASKTTKETGATSPIKRAKGGFQEILDVETAMAENVLSSKKSIRMNELGIELAKCTGNQAMLEEIGYQPKWTPDAIMSLNGNVILNEDGRYLYNVYINGELKQFNITEELYEGLRKDTLDSKIRNNKVLNTLLTPVEKLTKAQRDLLTTYSVGFALNNPIKDFQDGLFYTKYSTGEFLKNYTVALQEIAKNGEYYKKYMALGGMDNSYFEYGNGIKSEVSGVKKLFNKIQKINGILETAPRLAEYITSIQNGATQNEAMYNASDITTNFKRGGELTKIANKYGSNFLNASVQGLDKFVRTFTNLNTKIALKLIVRVASMGILPTLLNGLLYKDDDDYEKLEDYIKDEYYLIKISDDGDFIRIPKGRVLATISSATRTLIDGAKNGKVDLKGFKDEAIKQLAPNNPLEDNLLAPVIQVANNKTWYGTDLVPSRLQNQLPKNQYNEKTDKISLWLGENLNISPIKINYLIDQYSGGIGDVILPMLTPQAENNIITDKFTTSSISKNKTVGEFYDALDKYEKLKNDSKATEEEKIKYDYLSKISSKVGKLYAQKREVQMDSTLSDKEKKQLVKEIQKEINSYTECAMDTINGEYTTENKWNMFIDGIISDKVRESDGNSALQDALYIINNGIATKEEYMDMYQLSKDNDLSIPTMKTLVKLKNNNVKLTSYTDFKIGTKNYKADKDEEDKTISGTLNAKKATYIMDMDISKEQKKGLLNVLSEGTSYNDLSSLKGNYTTYFQQSGKAPKTGGLSAREKYMSLINVGIDIDELNKFYEQIGNIEALKDENGKTISGSKKQLIFNYVNSLKLSVPQKMILLAKQYKSFGKGYIKDILQYITSSNSSKSEKIKLIYMLYKS